MSSEGSITKRCTCKDPVTKKRLNNRCAKLRRPSGAWSTTHGTWGYQIEMPTAGTKRCPLRRSGFDSKDDARAELDHVRSLLDLAGDDTVVAVQIGDMLHASKSGDPLPNCDDVADRIRAGVPASVEVTTGQYLNDWLTGRRGLSEKDAARLRRRHPPLPRPAPGGHPAAAAADQPRPGHVQSSGGPQHCHPRRPSQP